MHTLQANKVILYDLQVQNKPVWLDNTCAIQICMCCIAMIAIMMTVKLLTMIKTVFLGNRNNNSNNNVNNNHK